MDLLLICHDEAVLPQEVGPCIYCWEAFLCVCTEVPLSIELTSYSQEPKRTHLLPLWTMPPTLEIIFTSAPSAPSSVRTCMASRFLTLSFDHLKKLQRNLLSLRLEPPLLRSSFLKAESLDKEEPVYSSQPVPSPSCHLA